LVGRRSGASFGLGDRLTVRLDSVNVSERSILGTPMVYPVRAEDVEINEGGQSRLTRKAREKTSWGKHTSRDQRDQKLERKQDRRRERRAKDDRKKSKGRR
jgi:hypothetical protein